MQLAPGCLIIDMLLRVFSIKISLQIIRRSKSKPQHAVEIFSSDLGKLKISGSEKTPTRGKHYLEHPVHALKNDPGHVKAGQVLEAGLFRGGRQEGTCLSAGRSIIVPNFPGIICVWRTHDEHARKIYNHLISKTGVPQKAIAALARRLAIILWRISLEGRPYRPILTQ